MSRLRRHARRVPLVAVALVAVLLSTSCATTITWAGAPVPLPPSAPSGAIERVSCATVDLCLAVSAPATAGSVVWRWTDGQWEVVDHPVVTDPALWLHDVSCASASSCIVSGARQVAGETVAALLRFDGGAWEAVELVGPPAVPLTSVSCATPDSCLAAGNGAAFRWDGASWAAVTPPAGALAYAETRVTCAGADDCLALTFLFGPVTRNEIHHWDGTTWTIERDMDPTEPLLMQDIACSTGGRCVAVGLGRADTPTGTRPAVLERSGTTWHEVWLPTADVRGLSAVSCSSDGTCVAFGGPADVFSTSPAEVAMVSRAAGSWSIGTVPPADLGLVALSCVPGSCAAVGRSLAAGQTDPTPTAATLTL